MQDAHGTSLLDQGREEFSGGFRPLLLWRDRRRILADPVVAARPRPPLANGPLRFALALGLTPLLIVAWLTSALVGLLPDAPQESRLESRSAAIIEALQPQFPLSTPADVDSLSRAIARRRLSPEARELGREAFPLAFFQPLLPHAERRAALEAWAGRVRASGLPRLQQDVVIARVLDSAYATQRGDRFMAEVQRNVAEGGPLMQFLAAMSLIASAWLFGQTVRGDVRFTHAERADSFYLYYTTSRVFWFLPAQTLTYGVLSFASASGNAGLMQTAQAAMMILGAASFVYLMAGAAPMARALADGQPASRGATWAVAWRMFAASMVSTFLVFTAMGLMGVVVGFVSAMQAG